MIRSPEQILSDLAIDAREELTRSILPFWASMMRDNVNGGFYGRIDGENNIIADSPKGAILNARILWTFSAAYEALKEPSYLETATRARNYIFTNFFDEEHGGTYWSLMFGGDHLDAKKQIYSQAFFIYALSQHYKTTGDPESLDRAIELFHI